MFPADVGVESKSRAESSQVNDDTKIGLNPAKSDPRKLKGSRSGASLFGRPCFRVDQIVLMNHFGFFVLFLD